MAVLFRNELLNPVALSKTAFVNPWNYL